MTDKVALFAIRIIFVLALVHMVGYFLVNALAGKDLTGEIFALLGGAIGATIGCIWSPHRASSKP